MTSQCKWNCDCLDCLREDILLDRAVMKMEGDWDGNETQIIEPNFKRLAAQRVAETQKEWVAGGMPLAERIANTATLYYSLIQRTY